MQEDPLIFVCKTSGMVRGFALVFFLSMMELCVLSQPFRFDAECRKTAYIPIPCDCPSCNLSIPITNMRLEKGNKTAIIKMWTKDDSPFCSQDKNCFKIAKGGNQTLIVHSPSFEDQGCYTLNIRRPGCSKSYIINFYVNGVCEPELSTNEDGLTCSVKMNSTYKPKITWMANGKKNETKQHSKNLTTDFFEFRSSINLTEETKKVQMCCIVSYENNGKQYKQKCTNHQDLPDAEKIFNNDKRNTNITVVCVLVFIGFGVAYLAYRYRRHLKGGCSNSNLLGFKEENTESSVKLQSSQDLV